MARIRTIKPEFFSSADVLKLSPLARVLYIALWCEADREGRMEWKPETFAFRYLPKESDQCESLCEEIVSVGLIKLYGDGLAYIPKFTKHQVINNKEGASTLESPDACYTRESRVLGEGRKEGKERKEGSSENKDESRELPIGIPPLREEVIGKMKELGFLDPEFEATKFFDYWDGKDWKRNNEPMKNWKLSCNTWKTNSVNRGDFPGNPPAKASTSPYGEGFGTDWGFDPDGRKESYTERGERLIQGGAA